MNYRRLHELAEELEKHWNMLHGLYLDSVIGFSLVHQRISNEQAFIREWLKDSDVANEDFQDQCSFTYTTIFSKEFCASGIHSATQGEIKERNRPGGLNWRTLGQMCIVSFYDYWNEYFRKEYAVAKGFIDPSDNDQDKIRDILAKYVQDDFWGDMRILRISIVHHRGIAVSEIKNCRLIKWFSEGDEINLSPEMMRQIFLAVLCWRNRIFSESLSKTTIRIPATSDEVVEEDRFVK